MAQDRFQRVQSVFERVAAAPADQRSVLLESLCPGEASLAEEVRSLLEFHAEEEAGVLDPNAVRELAKAETADEPVLSPGTRVADYTVLGTLGAGGMGVVYLAQQDRPRRTVALKLLRFGYQSRTVLRRFEREAEVLGMLQHPGIAQIFEAGAADLGRGPQPYIAMEFVNGASLTSHCTREKATTERRVELLAGVCEAVHHAHQRGVIHRDLKPGNILVDQHGSPKVLDFGVSRATENDPLASMHTITGQLIGTLSYMSPEQVSGETGVDVRSDVYALGVILFELLTGQLPFDVRTKPIAEAARLIHDTEPRRLSAVAPALRGDLDVIAAKAIEKDPTRRYQSAADLADDLRRFLIGAPISAKQDSFLYVVRKQVRRHRLASALVAAFFVSVTTLGVYSTFQAYRADRMARTARDESQRAQNAALTATIERERANQSARQAALDLRVSNIERGRLLGFSGGMLLAEEQLWPALFRDPFSAHAFWALWELYGNNPCRATILTDSGAIRGTAFSPDGRWLAAAVEDGDVNLYDAASGRFVSRVATRLPLPRVGTLKFSPDGRFLALVDTPGNVYVWSVPDFRCVTTFEAASVRGVRGFFSPDSSLYALASLGGIVSVYRTDDWTERWWTYAHRADAVSAAFSPDSRRLLSTANEVDARIWDADTGALLTTLRGHADVINASEWWPDGSLAITGGGDREVRFWDPETGACVSKYNPNNGTIGYIHVSPDAKKMIVTGWWRFDIIDIPTWRLEASFYGHRRGMHAATWSPDSKSVATGSIESEIRIWDLPSAVGPASAPGHGHRVTAVGLNKRQDRVLSASWDKWVILREWPSMREITRFRGGGAYGNCALFLGDGSRFAHITQNNEVLIRDSSDGQPLCAILPVRRAATAMAATDDGGTLYVAAGGALISAWDTKTGALLDSWGGEGRDPLWMKVSKDGARVDLSQRDFVWQSWDLDPFRPRPTITTRSPAWALDISPSGGLAALTNWASEIQVWNQDMQAYLGTLFGHRQLISGCVFAPSERFLWTASTDATAKLWDLKEYRALLTLRLADDTPLNTIALAPDGRNVVVGGYDGALHVWDLNRFDRHIAGNLESQVRRLIGPSSTPEELENVRLLREWAAKVLGPDAPAVRPGGLSPPL